jgi:hypothetical protein
MVCYALSKCAGIFQFNVLFGIFDARKTFLGAGKTTLARNFLAFHILLHATINISVLRNMLLKFNAEWG